MKTQILINSEQMHRVLAQFLLEETQKQFFLAHRGQTIEDKLISALVDENRSKLDEKVFMLVNNTTWWRRVKLAIEDCGLNHFAMLQALKEKN